VSILTKILSPIIRPLIRKEIKRVMEKYTQAVLDFLFKLADKYGTKFIVALGGIAAVFYLTKDGQLQPLYACGGIVVMVVAYMVARRQQEKEQRICEDKEDEDAPTDPTN
jgi:hypothetical protein